MKIYILGSAYPFRGGLASYNERLALELQREGHEVIIYTFTVQYPNFLFPGKSQFSKSSAPKNLDIVRCVNSVNPFNWWRIGQKIRKESPDLLLTKFWLPFMGPCFGTILWLAKKNKKTKIISILDNIIPHEKRFGDIPFTKYFVKPVDAFITMSDGVLRDLDIFDVKKPRVLTPHPLFDNFGDIDTHKNAIQKLQLDENCKYLLFFGFVRAYKGLDLLLQAFAKIKVEFPELKLIIAGEFYEDFSKYEEIIQDLELEKDVIIKDDFIPNEEVAHYFNAAELVVQPYKSATQSGVTQIAYHFEKPMIVTNVGGLGEMCPDGKVGYVVEPVVDEIAGAIRKFFIERQSERMIACVREEKKKYSWNILTKNIFILAEQIFSAKSNDIQE